MKVFILKLARNDLQEIREYLSEFGESPAKKFRESFENFYKQVSDMPYTYAQYVHNPLFRRAVIIFGYLVFYGVDESRNIVRVYRVLHGKRNVEL